MRITSLACALLLAVVTLSGQSRLTFDPARASVIDKALQKYVDSDRVAGLVALVMQDGQVVYDKAFGWADKEAGRRMQPDTIFRIASFTTLGALHNVQRLSR